MLNKSHHSPTRGADLQRYLHETLGVMAKISGWEGDRKTPYYLRDAFELLELTLLDQRILLAVERRKKAPPAASVREQMNVLGKIADIPVAYVTKALASYERKRLIGQKVPFIVPGNQLYLPGLGIDLREYFRQHPHDPETGFNPSTQAMLITALLRTPWDPVWQPAEAAAKLGYTPMTVSRAVKELTAAGIGELHRDGRVRSLYFGNRPDDIWERAKPLLRSPVKRTVWANPVSAFDPSRAPVAGLSALAQHTLLAEPQWPVRAVRSRQWLSARRADLETLPEPTPGAYQWQIWAYDPNLGIAREVIDPLSLTLSLQGESDERIQLALDELKEQFPW